MDLTVERQAEAQRLYATLKAATDAGLLALARLLARTADGDLFGRTEVEVRDRVPRVGARARAGTRAGRKKGGTGGAAPPAAGATGGPASSGIRPGDSLPPSANSGTSGRTTTAGTAGPGWPRPTPPSTSRTPG